MALDSVFSFCKLWSLELNTTKTKIVIFSRGKVRKHINFTFDKQIIEVVENYTYLGTVFHYNNKFNKAIDKQIGQAKRTMFALLTKSRRLCLPIDVILDLFDKIILPILLYGCEYGGTPI